MCRYGRERWQELTHKKNAKRMTEGGIICEWGTHLYLSIYFFPPQKSVLSDPLSSFLLFAMLRVCLSLVTTTSQSTLTNGHLHRESPDWKSFFSKRREADRRSVQVIIIVHQTNHRMTTMHMNDKNSPSSPLIWQSADRREDSLSPPPDVQWKF